MRTLGSSYFTSNNVKKSYNIEIVVFMVLLLALIFGNREIKA